MDSASDVKTCPECDGHARWTYIKNDRLWIEPCDHCHGTGTVIDTEGE